MSARATRRWVVRGRVQGVGFRWFVRSQAARLGVAGWVANREDGSVEVVGQAEPASLDRLEARLREGPPGAAVASLEAAEAPHEAVDSNSFIIKH